MFVLGDVAQIALESTLDELQELTNFYLARPPGGDRRPTQRPTSKQFFHKGRRNDIEKTGSYGPFETALQTRQAAARHLARQSVSRRASIGLRARRGPLIATRCDQSGGSRTRRTGWRSLRRALASICRTRSRVMPSRWPTSPRLYSRPSASPKRKASTSRSRSLRLLRAARIWAAVR